ncbi:MAG TPA: SLBB domain-containing protein [Bacteroidota bacterium]|nr:SLBB domain-containing protein [Bacteroidota bacterium]
MKSRWSIALAVMVLVAVADLRAQQTAGDIFKQLDQSQTQYQQQGLQNVKIAVMDGVVDPKEYIVGPGDIYNVSVWTTPPFSFQLPVTPEGTIIIPTVGEVSIAGTKLDEAKKKVVSVLRRKFISGDISFTLYAPRTFAVTVQGVVKKEGTVYIQATERVDEAIAQANLLETRPTEIKPAPEKPSPVHGTYIVQPDTVGSMRKIIIRHKDGTRGSADLEKYFVRKDPRLNPLLQDGDVIIVPKQDLAEDFVGVFGAVNEEGVYEYVPGDSLYSMLMIARGMTALADSDSVEVIRSDEYGRLVSETNVNVRAIISGELPDFPLRRGDRILVKEKVELQRDYRVYIEGDVLHPGYYPISKDSTTLSAIIEEAGGFKKTASLSGAQLFRMAKSTRGADWIRLENARGESMQEDSVNFKVENSIRMQGELVVADFVSLFANNDKSKDVYLRDGDRIIIPSQKKTVYVFGQVIEPGHVLYLQNRNYKYYIAMAGGFTDDAVKGDVKIIKAGSRQWLSPDETTIEDGDYIWVPKEPYRPFGYYLQIYSQLFGIIGTVATLVVLVIQSRK